MTPLTEEEIDILELIVHGKTNREIAMILGFSYGKARQKTWTIARRFGITGPRARVRLAALLVRRKMVEVEDTLPTPKHLSSEQKEIIKMLAVGKTSYEIAGALRLTHGAACRRIRTLYRMFRVRGPIAGAFMSAIAAQLGLVDDTSKPPVQPALNERAA